MDTEFTSLDNLMNHFVDALADRVSDRLKAKMEASHPQRLEDDLIYKQDAMEKYHFCASTAHRWQQRGHVKPFKIGRKVFYRESDIRRAMNISAEDSL
jgi:hypothetical protein